MRILYPLNIPLSLTSSLFFFSHSGQYLMCKEVSFTCQTCRDMEHRVLIKVTSEYNALCMLYHHLMNHICGSVSKELNWIGVRTVTSYFYLFIVIAKQILPSQGFIFLKKNSGLILTKQIKKWLMQYITVRFYTCRCILAVNS